MKANFYIHGVPKGQDIWGSEQDRDYIKSFYSASYAENVRFVVEIIPAKKRAFYTYLRAKNVYGAENREGSYFGMTISLDGVYCTDNESLFTLFDTIFNKRIVGSMLQNNGGNLRFTLPAFDGKSKELESLQSEFLKQLDSFAEDLEKIDSTFAGAANGQLAYYHTSEVDSSNFFAVLKQTLKVYISPEYATKDAQIASLRKQVDPEKAKNKQLSEDNAQLEERLSVATEKGKRNDSEIASLRSDKQKLEEESKSLRNENSSLKNELERNKAKNSVERSLSQIKQPLEDLLKGVRKLVPSSTFEEHHHHVYRAYEEEQRSSRRDLRSIIIDAIIVATFILMMGLCGFVIYKSVLSQPESKVKEPKKEQTTNIPAPKVPKPTICVNGLEDGGEIEREKEYLVTLLNYPNGKQIKWKLDGVDTPNNRNEAQIKVKTVAGSDKVTISCYVIEDTGENLIDKKQWIIKN